MIGQQTGSAYSATAYVPLSIQEPNNEIFSSPNFGTPAAQSDLQLEQPLFIDMNYSNGNSQAPANIGQPFVLNAAASGNNEIENLAESKFDEEAANEKIDLNTQEIGQPQAPQDIQLNNTSSQENKANFKVKAALMYNKTKQFGIKNLQLFDDRFSKPFVNFTSTFANGFRKVCRLE